MLGVPSWSAAVIAASCSCGLHYAPEAFERLPFVGILAADGCWCEMRNCRCGSTIARAIGPQPEWMCAEAAE